MHDKPVYIQTKQVGSDFCFDFYVDLRYNNVLVLPFGLFFFSFEMFVEKYAALRKMYRHFNFEGIFIALYAN